MEDHVFVFTVTVKGTEDTDDVRAYFKQLETVFSEVIHLSAWAYDTPIVIATSNMNRRDDASVRNTD